MRRKYAYVVLVLSIFTLLNIQFESKATDARIASGIRQFQIYINNNLPPEYLGTPLVADGVCGSQTKIKAIKLIQYKINLIYNTDIDINGVFDTNTQAAFEENVGTIKKNDQGFWVFVLQGLLYCNNYDPNGFDGSYGVGGGVGCLNAVNSFKEDNSIDEYPNPLAGEVGVKTMTSLCWNTYQFNNINDGIYYIKNLKSTLYLEANDNSDYTKVGQGEKKDFCLSQMWKVKYLGGGYYSIRPLHKLSMALDCTSQEADIYTIGRDDTIDKIPSYAKWKISKSNNGYILKNCNTSGYLSANDDNVCVIPLSEDSKNHTWVFECVDYDRDNTVLSFEDTVDIIMSDTFNSMIVIMLFGVV